VFLRDVWPSAHEVRETIERSLHAAMYRSTYADVFRGDERWQAVAVPQGNRYAWDPASTYVKRAPYFEGMPREAPSGFADVRGARVLAWLGDSVTTDHISPAGSIAKDSPAARYLLERGVAAADWNQYGARRGNHEVMARGTFANVRLKNRLAGGKEGGFTRHLPSGVEMPIFDAAERYAREGVPLVVLAGKEYGSGSSRDWAAKGPRLQGVRAVVAESYERIHRSNLVGMGVLPLEFPAGRSAESLGLTGHERFEILGLAQALEPGSSREVVVRATPEAGPAVEFRARVRIDTATEADYYRHGGILPYVLRGLLAS
jgi:aconitate hydratase